MADVLIMNIKMPNCCGLCPCFHYEHPMYCQASKDVKIEAPYIYVAKGCPLVEVPPHGRLIDADALLPKSGYDPMMFKHKYDGDHRTQYDTLMGYEILGIVEDAPTVLEAST